MIKNQGLSEVDAVCSSSPFKKYSGIFCDHYCSHTGYEKCLLVRTVWKPRAYISLHGTCKQLVNSLLDDPY